MCVGVCAYVCVCVCVNKESEDYFVYILEKKCPGRESENCRPLTFSCLMEESNLSSHAYQCKCIVCI